MPFLTDQEVLQMQMSPQDVLGLLTRRLAALDVVYSHFPPESILARCAKKKYAALRMAALALEDGLNQMRNRQLDVMLSSGKI